jgi:glycosyltransferase involved in cell wall biosynthesis
VNLKRKGPLEMRIIKDISFVLITAARNEEAYIEKTIQSVIVQKVLPLRWVIVNDGSVDSTPELIKHYASQYPWIERIDMPAHRERSFAGKAYCFNAGYDKVKRMHFDVVGNIDADVSFEYDYLEFLMEKFALMPKLGVAGTIFREDGYDSSTNSFEGVNHVAGGCQFFRRKCFEEVGGYIPHPAGGVDWIAVTTARMKGWQTRSFRDKHFFHYRRLGTAGRSSLAAVFSYGAKDYYLGNHSLWEFFRVLYRLGQKPCIAGGLALGAGYLSAAIRGQERPVSKELMRFHRKEELQKLRAIFSSLLRFHRIDSFTVIPKN